MPETDSDRSGSLPTPRSSHRLHLLLDMLHHTTHPASCQGTHPPRVPRSSSSQNAYRWEQSSGNWLRALPCLAVKTRWRRGRTGCTMHKKGGITLVWPPTQWTTGCEQRQARRLPYPTRLTGPWRSWHQPYPASSTLHVLRGFEQGEKPSTTRVLERHRRIFFSTWKQICRHSHSPREAARDCETMSSTPTSSHAPLCGFIVV